jgi:hypothetical protein
MHVIGAVEPGATERRVDTAHSGVEVELVQPGDDVAIRHGAAGRRVAAYGLP